MCSLSSRAWRAARTVGKWCSHGIAALCSACCSISSWSPSGSETILAEWPSRATADALSAAQARRQHEAAVARAGLAAERGTYENAWLTLRHHYAAGDPIGKCRHPLERNARRRAYGDRLDELRERMGCRDELWA